jgi:hypothetical protein
MEAGFADHVLGLEEVIALIGAAANGVKPVDKCKMIQSLAG